MKIAIACDHESFQLKEALIPYLKSLGHSVRDFGSHSPRPCDYPDYALEAAKAVSSDDCDKGIVLCATGVGASIAANKVTGIRCALANDVDTAKSSRQYQDANMLALGAAVVDQTTAFAIVEAWLTTPFSNDDEHQNRIDKIMESEKQKEKKLTDEINQLKKHRCKNKRTPYRPKHFGIINKAINMVLIAVLVVALCLVPVANFVTNMANPRLLVEALFDSGFFESDPDGATETPETTEPDVADSGSGEPAVASSKSFGKGYTSKLDGEGSTLPGVGGAGSIGGTDPGALDIDSILSSLQGLVDAGLIDEETLNTSLGEGVEVDMEKVGTGLLESELAKELAAEYVGSIMDSAMDPEAESTFTEEKVREIMDKHMDELTEIVNNSLPEGHEIPKDVVQGAVSGALDAALPSVMESLPDTSEAAQTLINDNPMIGSVLKALKFITSGALRAIVLLVVLVLCIVIAVFRLPGLYGLTLIGISGIVAGITCCGLHLLCDTTSLVNALVAGAGEMGAVFAPLLNILGGLADDFYVSAIVFSFLGICLVLGTTILRGVFGRLFHAIFAD